MNKDDFNKIFAPLVMERMDSSVVSRGMYLPMYALAEKLTRSHRRLPKCLMEAPNDPLYEYARGVVVNIVGLSEPSSRYVYYVEMDPMDYEELSGDPLYPVMRRHPYPLALVRKSLRDNPPSVGDSVILRDAVAPVTGSFCSLTAEICCVSDRRCLHL